jgi:hypothetical protein
MTLNIGDALSFAKVFEAHPFQDGAVEEQVPALASVDEAESAVDLPLDGAFSHLCACFLWCLCSLRRQWAAKRLRARND